MARKKYARKRPDFRFAIEWDQGEMHLVFADKRIPVEESNGQFWFSNYKMLGPSSTLPDLFEKFAVEPVFDKVDLEPVTNVGSSPFKVRKNFLDLSEFERLRFAEALNFAYDSGFIKKAARGHQRYVEHFHNVPQFLPWHRLFILRLERKMQQFDPDVTLPYWDTMNSDSNSFSGEMLGTFFGGRSNSSGPFQHWNFTREATDPPLNPVRLAHLALPINAATYSSMRAMETSPVHSWGHFWVGGHMGSPASPRDPLFWLHHCNIDRIWAIWQRHNPLAAQYDTAPIAGDRETELFDQLHSFMEPAGMGITFSTQALLDHRNWGYAYPTDTRLEQFFQDEYSKAIFSGDSPEFTISPKHWDFATVEVGESGALKLRMQNALSSQADVHVDSSASQGGLQEGFYWDEMSRTFSPGEVKTLPIMFVPSNAGLRSTELKVVVDTGGTAAVASMVKLFGKGD